MTKHIYIYIYMHEEDQGVCPSGFGTYPHKRLAHQNGKWQLPSKTQNNLHVGRRRVPVWLQDICQHQPQHLAAIAFEIHDVC